MKRAIYFILILCAGSVSEASAFKLDPELPDLGGNYSLYRTANGCGPQSFRALEAASQSSERICRREGENKDADLVPSAEPSLVHSIVESCWAGLDSSAVAFAFFKCVPRQDN